MKYGLALIFETLKVFLSLLRNETVILIRKAFFIQKENLLDVKKNKIIFMLIRLMKSPNQVKLSRLLVRKTLRNLQVKTR